MPRETKAEKEARIKAEQEQNQRELEQAYPQIIWVLAERACKVGFTLTVENGLFVFEDPNDRHNTKYIISLEYSVDNYLISEEFDWKVTDRECERQEKQRKQQLRATALTKLTEEEREVLGI
jgi:hypothetical protein